MKKFFAVVPAVAAALVFSQAALAASLNPYSGQGSDISWPQCGTKYPTGAAFGIVGIDHGRPFDVDNQYGPNTCLGSEYGWAQKTAHADLYMNTGYDPTYYTNHAVPDCQSVMGSHGADLAHQQAWEVGCATAWFNVNYATGPSSLKVGNYTGQNLPLPHMWWLDVETGNSWAGAPDLSYNVSTLQGIVDELGVLTPGIPVGAYSTRYQWGQITGDTTGQVVLVNNLTQVWVATGQRSSRNVTSYCSTAFDGFARAWLVQWVSRVDYDVSCGN